MGCPVKLSYPSGHTPVCRQMKSACDAIRVTFSSRLDFGYLLKRKIKTRRKKFKPHSLRTNLTECFKSKVNGI